MKIKIRRGMFETNSSSTHALCIKKDESNLKTYPKTMKAYLGEYHWGNETLERPQEIINYLYTLIVNGCGVSSYDPDDMLERFAKIVEDTTGCILTFKDKEKINDDNFYYGIDHQSYYDVDELEQLLQDENLKRILLNGVILVGNDNDCVVYDILREGNLIMRYHDGSFEEEFNEEDF